MFESLATEGLGQSLDKSIENGVEKISDRYFQPIEKQLEQREVGYTFEPYVGVNYEQGLDGVRVLQIGESHYVSSPEDIRSSMTKEIISDLYQPESEHEGYKNTYTKAERAITGNLESTMEDKKDFYEHTAFYNFVQEGISGPRIAPTKEQFECSAPQFFNTLEQLRPDVSVAWGKRLYDNMPAERSISLSPLDVNGKSYERCAYELSDGKKVEVLCMNHPSTAFSPSEWNKVYQAFVDDYKQRN